MKIAVVNDVLSASGEKTFWNVLVEELSATSVELNKGQKIPEDTDIVITNSLLGKITDKPYVSLLQDNYMEMEKLFGGCQASLMKQLESLKYAKIRVANTNHIASSYEKVCEEFKVIPLGTDTELFKPMSNKEELREKYDIPQDATVNIWVGSHHAVKGLDLVDVSKDFWIFVFKDFANQPSLPNVKHFCKVSQEALAELFNCADKFVSTSRMESQGLAAIEAMFCGLPVDATKVGIFWDWYPENKNPRQEAFDKSLEKKMMIERWKVLLGCS